MTHISIKQAICFRCNMSIDYSKSIDLNNNNMLMALFTNPNQVYSLQHLSKVLQYLKKNQKAISHQLIAAIEDKIKALQAQSPVKQPFIYQITNNPYSNANSNGFNQWQGLFDYNKPIEPNTKYIQSLFSSQSTDMSISSIKKKYKKRSYAEMKQENNDINAVSNSNSNSNSANDCPISTIDFSLNNKGKKFKYM